MMIHRKGDRPCTRAGRSGCSWPRRRCWPAAVTRPRRPRAGPASHPATSHPATLCGSARTPANVPVKIEVAKGTVACADAMTIEKSYTAAVAQGRAPGNGRGPVKISGWTCQAFTTPVSLKTGNVSACYRSGTEILAVLPPP